MKIRLFFDSDALISYEAKKGVLELEVEHHEFTSPFIVTCEKDDETYREYRSYHIRVSKRGVIKLTPYKPIMLKRGQL